MSYKHQTIEKKWQDYWAQKKSFSAAEREEKDKYYVLPMFPYPSGQLHVGHSRNYTFADIVARFKRAQGYAVLHPMGWDALGLPAENAAMQNGIHPKIWTMTNIKVMREQLRRLGCAYDWEREINTCDPEYFKNEQEIFITFLEHGLAYQKESVVNWDPVDQTVLANEQVIDGRCWRSGAAVERRNLKQWFLKITEFADELLSELKNLDGWPERVRIMQENWIGCSQGAVVDFYLYNIECLVDDYTTNKITIYTTRPDTLFGASFLAIAYNHPIVNALPRTIELDLFIKKCKQTAVSAEAIEKEPKLGYKTPLEALHPFDNTKKLPIYITNFVIMEYGTGAIFGCPAHDERDHTFAVQYSLPIIQVVTPEINKSDMQILKIDVAKQAFTQNGIVINSGFLNNLTTQEAKIEAIKKLELLRVGTKKTNYKLRDWGVSRQRYWGAPIPAIHCSKCGTIPASRTELPIKLPEDVDFSSGGNPIANHPTWKYVKCHICGANAKRETDTFDTFVESSWYFARFCAPHSEKSIDKSASEYWLPVDQYIGGIEHAVLHLLYARFFTKALKRCGYWNIKEPFKNLLTQGMVCHTSYKNSVGQWMYPSEIRFENGEYYEKKTGERVTCCGLEKMSKSKKNIVTLDEIISKYGADSARLFIVSDSPPERDIEWTESGIDGVYRYLNKLYNFVLNLIKAEDLASGTEKDIVLEKAINRAIYDVTESFQKMHFNKAVAHIRTLNNAIILSKDMAMQKSAISILLQLMNPIAPHITEEIWQMLHGKFSTILEESWPTANTALLTIETVTIAIQIDGKLRDTIEVAISATKDEVEELALHEEKVISYIKDKKISRIVYVPQKILNFVCSK